MTKETLQQILSGMNKDNFVHEFDNYKVYYSDEYFDIEENGEGIYAEYLTESECYEILCKLLF